MTYIGWLADIPIGIAISEPIEKQRSRCHSTNNERNIVDGPPFNVFTANKPGSEMRSNGYIQYALSELHVSFMPSGVNVRNVVKVRPALRPPPPFSYPISDDVARLPYRQMPPHSYDAQKTGEGCKLAELIHPALRVRIARRRYAMAGRGNLRNFDWDRGVWTTPPRQGWRSWRRLASSSTTEAETNRPHGSPNG